MLLLSQCRQKITIWPSVEEKKDTHNSLSYQRKQPRSSDWLLVWHRLAFFSDHNGVALVMALPWNFLLWPIKRDYPQNSLKAGSCVNTSFAYFPFFGQFWSPLLGGLPRNTCRQYGSREKITGWGWDLGFTTPWLQDKGFELHLLHPWQTVISQGSRCNLSLNYTWLYNTCTCAWTCYYASTHARIYMYKCGTNSAQPHRFVFYVTHSATVSGLTMNQL